MVFQILAAIVLEIFIAITTGLGIMVMETHFYEKKERHATHSRRTASHE